MHRLAAALVVGLLLQGAGALRAQDDELATACLATASPECYTAVAAARSLQTRVGLSLFGGSPVPGTASTLGMRLPGVPRAALSARVTVLPISIPPLLDPPGGGETALIPSIAVQVSVAAFSGFAPMPAVGGVLSLDALLRASHAWLPESRGFRDRGATGWSVGARVGLLRESLWLPGLSITGTYGRAGTVTFGDPLTGSTAGFVEAPVTDRGATLALSRHVGKLDLAVGAAVHRYGGAASLGYSSSALVAQRRVDADASSAPWSGFASAGWSGAITRFAVEAGWQQTYGSAGTDAGWRGSGWWASGAFRLIL